MQATPFSCQLDGTLIGLATTIGKKHAIETRSTRNALGQINGRLVIKGGRGVDQFSGLLLQGFHQWRRAMAQAVHRPALKKIKIALARMVFKPRALPFGENKVRTGSNFHQRIHAGTIKFHRASRKMKKETDIAAL